MRDIIESIKAREILDSRGNPTLEVEVKVNGTFISASVPSGASTGTYEALELRDGNSRYHGKGVRKAVENVSVIAKKIVGMEVSDQNNIDKTMIELDGTPNKGVLGANTIVGVSLAVLRASAFCSNIPLYKRIGELINSNKFRMPYPQMNVINGGEHAGQKNDIQEHMIVPHINKFSEALRVGVEIYHALKKKLKEKYGVAAVQLGDEGGFVPPINNVEDRLEMLASTIEELGYTNEVRLALDCAASEFFLDGVYTLGASKYTPEELVDYYSGLVKTYSLYSIEDGMAEEDWPGWKYLSSKLKIQIVGDDLLVTNTERIKRAIKEHSCNGLLLKVNQIGTVTEALEACKLAFSNKWSTIVSHRSGETEDPLISDLVVGLSSWKADQSKFGAPARGERTSKYNRLLTIEEQL